VNFDSAHTYITVLVILVSAALVAVSVAVGDLGAIASLAGAFATIGAGYLALRSAQLPMEIAAQKEVAQQKQARRTIAILIAYELMQLHSDIVVAAEMPDLPSMTVEDPPELRRYVDHLHIYGDAGASLTWLLGALSQHRQSITRYLTLSPEAQKIWIASECAIAKERLHYLSSIVAGLIPLIALETGYVDEMPVWPSSQDAQASRWTVHD
jgi:hypothetical protein